MPVPANVLFVTAEAPANAPLAGVTTRAVRAEDLGSFNGDAPNVVVIGRDVDRQTAVGRSALRQWPSAKILFLAAPERLVGLQASLPFIPELAGAVALSDEASDNELRDVLEQLAETAERDRQIQGLYGRLNTRVEALQSSKAALHERHQQLLLAERYLATVLEHSPQALVSTDLAGVVVSCNQVAAELFAVEGDGSGLSLTEQFDPGSRPAVRAALAQAAGGRTVRVEGRLTRATAALTVEFSAAPVLGVDGRIAGLSVALLDVTERKRIEAALADSNRRLNAVLDNATVAIFLMDERQHCAYMNDAAERLTGYSWEETRGRPLHDVIHHTRPDGRPYPLHECPIDRAFPENNQQQGQDVFVHKDGHFYPVAFTASPIRDETSRTIGTIIEVRDITEEVRNAEARELLMREVDHRARNVLAVAQSMVQLTRAADVESFKSALQGRISALARAQTSLSKSAWHGADLRQLVAEELETFGHLGSYQVSGGALMLSPEQVQPLSMVIHELATNAAKYGAFSRPGGRLELSWSTTGAGETRLVWTESGVVLTAPPTSTGFGSRLIRNLAKQLGGSVRFEWGPDGLTVTLAWPTSRAAI